MSDLLAPILTSPALLLTRNLLVLVTLSAVFAAALTVPTWMIARKLGFSRVAAGLLVLGLLVPGVSLIAIWVMAIGGRSAQPLPRGAQ